MSAGDNTLATAAQTCAASSNRVICDTTPWVLVLHGPCAGQKEGDDLIAAIGGRGYAQHILALQHARHRLPERRIKGRLC